MNIKTGYKAAQRNARIRGVVWDLTLEDWYSLWSLKWHLRGTSKGSLQMCRTKDKGPYSLENVRIDTVENNRAEHNENVRLSIKEEARAKILGTLRKGRRQR